MATKAGTLELVARELGSALAPLEQRLQGGGAVELLGAVGVRVPASVASHAQVVGAIGAAVTSAAALAPDLAALIAAIDADDEAQILTHGIAVITGAGNVISALTDLAQALNAATNASPLAATEKAALQAALNGIHRRLFDFIVVEYIESQSVPAVEALTLLGIVDKVFVPGDPANPMTASFVRRELRIDRFSDLMSDPLEYLKATYKFGASEFDGRALFVRIKEFLEHYDYPVLLIEPPGQPPILEAYLLSIEPQPTNPPSLGLKFRFKATQDYEREYEVADPWSFRVAAKARFDAGMDGTITPPLGVSLTPPAAGASLELNADMVAEDGGTPMVMLGEAGGSRLEAARFSAGFGFKAKTEGGALTGEPVVRAEVKGGRLVIDMSRGDGFINTILSGIRVESKFELAARWTPSDGIRFEGGADVELVVPLNLNLGPVEIQTLYFLLGFAADPPLSVGVAAAIGVQIGPFGMSVDKIGLDVPIRFPPERDGNLGAVDLAFAFRPPTGIGVVVDAGPISGGGFLSIDVPNGRYAGILQLETPLVSITAIGLLDTRLPGGVQGFSFLILVSVELPPIQLGFGFTFNGVGGMAGIHRTVAVDVMRQSVRTGGLNSVMFPRDPIRNAPQIIADLRAFFPPAQNRFVFGPFLKVGWGTPSLITGNLGVILELPDPVRILILGQLEVALPVPELPLVSLNLDVLGVIDFGEQTLSIDASLYDSRVTIYSLYGDMALRLSWGAQPIFALSIGGLHPQFKPPPNFPTLRRCTIEIGIGNNPRLSCMSYFAITANSVQFGARIEAYAKAAGFSIHGWLGYDAIVIFVPFSFRVDISGGVELKRGNSLIAGIHLNASLSGPNPWHAEGRACISLFLFDVCVPFRITIGEEQGQPVPTINAWDRLQAALEEVRNWQSELPAGERKAIGYAVPAGSALTLIDPAGGLAVQQKVLPLNKPLDKIGEARIEGDMRFDVSHVRVGGQNEAHELERDFFAAGQYQNLSEAEKLSRDSYELMDAGVAIAGAAVTIGDIRETPLLYETIVIDAPDPGTVAFRDFLVRRLGTVVMTQAEFSRMAERAAHELHPRKGMERFAPAPGAPPRMKMAEELYVLASTNTMKIHGTVTKAMTKGAAHDALRDLVRSNPAEAGQWQVLSEHDAEAA
jgi:hypothetical protein